MQNKQMDSKGDVGRKCKNLVLLLFLSKACAQ